jgi:hypothetical protein
VLKHVLNGTQALEDSQFLLSIPDEQLLSLGNAVHPASVHPSA